MITRDDLEFLMTADAQPAVSIFLPTARAAQETRQAPIRLKNLLKDAVERLTEMGVRRPDADALLDPAVKMIDDAAVWRHQDNGLALFLAPGVFRQFRVPEPFDDLVVVGRRFHVKPLLPLLAADGRYFVLTVTAKEVRLFEGSRHSLLEDEGAPLPRTVQEVFDETDYSDENRDAPPPGRPRVAAQVDVQTSHNAGEDPEEARRAQLIEFLRRLSAGLGEYLAGVRAPVVVMASDPILGYFRSLPRPENLSCEFVKHGPSRLPEAEIHAKAYKAVKPRFTADREQALATYHHLQGTEPQKASTRPEEILQAAHVGRVDSLFVATDQHLWGHVNDESGQVEIKMEASPEHGDEEDLTDYATVRTLLNGGRVFAVPSEALPTANGAMAAILRY